MDHSREGFLAGPQAEAGRTCCTGKWAISGSLTKNLFFIRARGLWIRASFYPGKRVIVLSYKVVAQAEAVISRAGEAEAFQRIIGGIRKGTVLLLKERVDYVKCKCHFFLQQLCLTSDIHA